MKKFIFFISTLNLLFSSEYFYDFQNIFLATKNLEKSYCINKKNINICYDAKISFNQDNNLTKLPYKINFTKINKNIIKSYKDLNIKEDVLERAKNSDTFANKQYSSTELKLYALNKNSYVFMQKESGYSGGAHGYNGTYFKNYNLNGNIIKLDDLFIKEYQNKLEKIAYKAYRDYRNLKPNQSLNDDCWFENDFVLAKEFAITSNGLEFLCNNYEVMPYACGQVKFVIPYNKLEPIVDKSSYLSEFYKPKKEEKRYFYYPNLAYIKLIAKKVTKNTIKVDIDFLEEEFFKNIYLSISLPKNNRVSKLKTTNFKSKIYKKGSKIYNFLDKKNIKSKYILIEATKKSNFENSKISFNVDCKNQKNLKLLLRAVFKNNKETNQMPQFFGSIGQQSYLNYVILIDVNTLE